jgi:hypothetical protein
MNGAVRGHAERRIAGFSTVSGLSANGAWAGGIDNFTPAFWVLTAGNWSEISSTEGGIVRGVFDNGFACCMPYSRGGVAADPFLSTEWLTYQLW